MKKFINVAILFVFFFGSYRVFLDDFYHFINRINDGWIKIIQMDSASEDNISIQDDEG